MTWGAGAAAAEVLWDSRDRGVGPCDQDVLKGRKEGEAKHKVCQVLTPTGAQTLNHRLSSELPVLK